MELPRLTLTQAVNAVCEAMRMQGASRAKLKPWHPIYGVQIEMVEQALAAGTLTCLHKELLTRAGYICEHRQPAVMIDVTTLDMDVPGR